MAAAGEPTTLAAIRPPAVPPGQNGIDDLLRAAGWLTAVTPASERRGKLNDVVWPLTTLERQRLAARFAETAYLMPTIDTALARPRLVSTTPLTSPGLMQNFPELNAARAVAVFLADAALLAHEQGRDDETLRRLVQTDRVAIAPASVPTLVGGLVAVGIHALAAEQIAAVAATLRIADRRDCAPPAAVRAVIAALLDDAGLDGDIRTAFRGERVMTLDSISNFGNPVAPGQFVRGSGVVQYALRPWVQANAMADLRLSTDVIATLSTPDWPTARAKLTALTTAASRPALTGTLVGLFATSPARVPETVYRLKADRRLAAVALAARWYELDHGRRPAALAELVPAYLPAVPLDPMTTGRPLSAKLDGDDPRVWSAGTNGVDDGGDESSARFGTPYGDWAGQDRVYHLVARPRTFDAQIQMLMDLDLYSPIRVTHATTRPLADDAIAADPGNAPAGVFWENVRAFDIEGDPAAFGFTERRDAFAALVDADTDVAPAARPATAPAARLWGTATFDDGVWRFELSPGGGGVLRTPGGKRLFVRYGTGHVYSGGFDFWR